MTLERSSLVSMKIPWVMSQCGASSVSHAGVPADDLPAVHDKKPEASTDFLLVGVPVYPTGRVLPRMAVSFMCGMFSGI